MRKQLAIASLFVSCSQFSYADQFLGIFVGANVWNQNYDGFVQDLNDDPILSNVDVENDLGLDDDNGNVLYVALEHPVLFLPNIRLQSTELVTESSSLLQRTIEFNGQTFTGALPVNSEIDLSHTDATFYYQVLDNWISIDLGLTARFFDGSVIIEEIGSNNRAEEEIEGVVPLLYGAARVDLPLSGLYASLQVHALGDGDNNLIDYQAALGYESGFGLGIEAGFRSMDLELDDIDDVKAELTVDGAFAGLFFHF